MRINAGDLASLLRADLDSAGFDGAMNPYPGQSPRQFAMMHQSRAFIKKYLMGTNDTSPEADAKALDLFTQVNDRCRDFVYDESSRPSWTRVALGEARAFLWDFFYPPRRFQADAPFSKVGSSWGDQDFILSLHEIAKGFGVGPGSSIGSPETDLYSKLALSDLSASSSALHLLYVQAIAHNSTWSDMENFRSQRLGYAIAESSRLSFVPKYTDISRTICTEPCLNMLFQKGIASVLERRLRQVSGIDLSSQQFVNRELARVGSLTGKFGTIDLSSASDSMSLTIVRRFFPADAVRWLERCRCPSTILPDGTKLELHMISSMGNGYTFPLQTIFFTALVYGAYKALGVKPRKSFGPTDLGNFAVNGDDIIVLREAYDLVVEMLSLTGFSVNVDKSFNTGLFRESCGADFYQGYNVRGVYLKRLRDVFDCYSAINRLNRWSASHLVGLPRTVGFLKRKVRFLPIPPDEDDSSGIKVPHYFVPQKRYNKDTGGTFYRKLVIRPRVMKVDPLIEGKQVIPWWFVNPSGLLVSFLAGGIREGCIVLRVQRRSPQTRVKYSSRWDYIPSEQVVRPAYGEYWKVFTSSNLNLGYAHSTSAI